ncbi:MAG: hypothetical protein RI922_1947 [Bacteroidota bacterium]
MKSSIVILFMFVALAFSEVIAQNIISIPFNNGFVGDNTAQNVSSNSVYLSSLGWTNVQFAQSTSGTTFTAQGNDIIGMIYITDANGVEHTINGYVKWRAPSGSVTALVFSPSSSAVLATNGSNGSSTYTISSSKYVGLIFNGMTLTIPTSGNNAGQVSGNAATSGLLTTLNDYLGTLPSISITDATVNESAGTVTVTLSLSTSSSNQVTVNYTTTDGTATKINDYSSVSGSIVFLAGQTSKPLTITITTDNISEFQETFYVNLSDAVNASIVKNRSTIIVYDASLPVELTNFSVNCENDYPVVNWQTASEHNSASFILERSIDGIDWELVNQIVAAGNSNTTINYQCEDMEAARFVGYYRLTQVDVDGKQKIYDPIYSNCITDVVEVEIYPNPAQGEFKISISSDVAEKQSITFVNSNGTIVFSEIIEMEKGFNQFLFNTSEWERGLYFVHILGKNTQTIKKLIVQ